VIQYPLAITLTSMGHAKSFHAGQAQGYFFVVTRVTVKISLGRT
jgi:hypothetical protein